MSAFIDQLSAYDFWTGFAAGEVWALITILAGWMARRGGKGDEA